MITKSYLVRKETIKEALDHAEEYMAKMELFISTHPEYSYTISIREVPSDLKFPRWEVQTNIMRYEKDKENRSSTSFT